MVAEADPADLAGRRHRIRLPTLRRRLNHQGGLARKDLFVDRHWKIVGAAQEKGDRIEFDFIEARAGGGLQANADSGARAELRGKVQFHDIATEVTYFLDAHGKKADFVRGLESASGLVAFAEHA